ncbi:MAG: hypothetical protein RL095_2648 [Verrucomicrobiota bacterium]|jgi:DNA sulfur modification protein DndD
MIFEEIILHNIGVFKGEHRVALAPPKKSQPIILIGGMNGAGKTTFLESLQLALYGKMATAGRMSGLSYEEYLRRLINRQTPAKQGAAVTLTFRIHEEGKERRYAVKRLWAESGSRIKESVQVAIDGEYDEVVSETWQERVGRFIPHQMAHLFFFDGDRIEALADPAKSAEVLRTAIDALLGVDLVDMLCNDLKALKQKATKDKSSDKGKEKLDGMEAQLAGLAAKLEDAKQDQAQALTELERTQKKLAELDKNYREQGGELAEKEALMRRERDAQERERDSLGRQLLDLATLDLPLNLCRSLIEATLEQCRQEALVNEGERLNQAVQGKMAGLLKRLKSLGLDAPMLKKVKAEIEAGLLDADESAVQRYLLLSSSGEGRLSSLISEGLNEQQARGKALVAEFRAASEKVDNLERKLAAVPDAGSLANLLQEREALRTSATQLSTRKELRGTQILELEKEHSGISTKLNRLYEDEHRKQIEDADIERLGIHSERVVNALKRFRAKVTEKHTHRLEELILESFRALLRKEGMIAGIEIEPQTCAVTLRDGLGRIVSPERLSMGERQLLAVAMLWGMAKASGRPLPVIIDTPLGRLDSEHRSKLVDRYFPKASHQVFLLSTDEEIKGEYLERLGKSIGRSYAIEFDNKTQSSRIREGYFA